MPLYFFDTSDGDFALRDDEGHELADREQARREALAALPDMAQDKMPDGDSRTFVVVVRDDQGRQIYQARLRLNGGWVS